MKIDFNDYGAVATVTITSTIFEFRKHNRVVDTTLFLVQGVISERRGSFFMKTRISGKTRDVLRAYKTALGESKR
ncbi:TPA: hypothetical protein ACQZKP_004620 [Klebsiella quasipneumoniae subsp. similipneumoniae]|uniref:hypothetical protein n=1 Tax=Klebsiella/Raoultella group TaxID=2890311 RepID=UPI0017812037|nr:hypothetical protein [Klebsiella quasipneumoniae]HBQ5642608.1 hypothetical protein [Klebsiella variicola]HBX7937706.1 hypothetical protein [Klebsiella pneumoniae]MBD8835592.1 hypothetical protein [Klebsiella quasipneumoniae]MBE5246303.1 hypothetical protein [Klebsiella quasipneumoniae]HBQ5645442.1 hypothetical protein [Klebsiella variicola]